MPYVSPAEVEEARKMDLLTYLQRYEPQELVCLSSGNYCTREHDSLKISNGKWHWFSHGVGGRSALDYLIVVKGLPFPVAVQSILGKTVEAAYVCNAEKAAAPQIFLMPELSECTDHVRLYLQKRGIHPTIIRFCIENRLLFESKDYHSAVFVGYDRAGAARSASVRSTKTAFKGEAGGSDRRYSFCIEAAQASTKVHVFESAIDLLSYATLELNAGRDWQREHLLSLAGVYQTKRADVVPLALEQFLGDHDGINTLYLHLDNDDAGRRAAKAIRTGIGFRCQVLDEPPKIGKDMNDQLRSILTNSTRRNYIR